MRNGLVRNELLCNGLVRNGLVRKSTKRFGGNRQENAWTILRGKRGSRRARCWLIH